MPSWNDDESLSPLWLGDVTDMDYAPDTVHDPTFCGLAVDCPEVCRVHKLQPLECVAFEGANTGRIFYLCSVENEVTNCGFVSWVDEEWSLTLKNALYKLWRMYEDSNSARIDDMVQNGKFIKDLSEEKENVKKKYSSLMADTKKFIEITTKSVMRDNLAKMKEGSVEDKLKDMQKERDLLQTEVNSLKEEKKKLEYMLYDLFKANKDKMKRIKQVCNE